MDLYLIQHGITEWNLQRKSQGHVNVPLNETGTKQAELLGQYLKDQQIDAIYSSDMSRTVESIRPLANAKDIEIVEDWRLREGRWPHQVESDGEYEVLGFVHEKYETHEDVLNRLITFLDEILERHEDGRVLIMTHGSVVSRLIFHIEGFSKWPFPPFQMQKMAVNLVRHHDDGSWEAMKLNDSDFLAREGLLTGRQRRKRRHRNIVYHTGKFCRKFMPAFSHPTLQRVLRKTVDKDREIAMNPWHGLENDPTKKN